MADGRTNVELADALDELLYERIPWPQRAQIVREAIRRLREPEGKRIVGWAWQKGVKTHGKWVSGPRWQFGEMDRGPTSTPRHATLILDLPESESDEDN